MVFESSTNLMQIDYSASWLFFELHVWDKSSWIKVQKLPAANKGRGTGISISTHTSPRKVQLPTRPRPLYEKLKNTDDIAGIKDKGRKKKVNYRSDWMELWQVLKFQLRIKEEGLKFQIQDVLLLETFSIKLGHWRTSWKVNSLLIYSNC